MKLTEKLNELEDSAIDVIGVFGPWLGPLPSAYLVYAAAIEHLDWPVWVAIVAAVAVESIGVLSVVLALRLYEWNETKNKSEPAAPLWLAVLLVAFYFIVTIGLTVVMDVIPELARFAPAIFPLLAAVGAVNIAIKNGQRRREADRLARKTERKSGAKKPAKPVSKPAKPMSEPVSETAYICSCGRGFGSQNALNGHKRACTVLANGRANVPANGSGLLSK